MFAPRLMLSFKIRHFHVIKVTRTGNQLEEENEVKTGELEVIGGLRGERLMVSSEKVEENGDKGECGPPSFSDYTLYWSDRISEE